MPKWLKKKSIASFWKKYNYLYRITVIAFFIGLNISLAKGFADQNPIRVPAPILSLLLRFGVIPGEKILIDKLTNPYAVDIELKTSDIIALINAQRVEKKLPPLSENEKLASAAALLMKDLQEDELDLESDGFSGNLEVVMKEVGYTYSWVHHNSLVGPLSAEAALTAWLSDAKQEEALFNEKFTEIGLATLVEDTKFMGKAGVIVQLLAQPYILPASSSAGANQTKPKPPQKLPEIGDYDVFTALNVYRQSHGVHQLVENQHLCTYAQKRVADLIAFGSLDGHQGFVNDFRGSEPPVGIKDYPGKGIGENLASQYCLNGTTGDVIMATTPQQLIEWCFDSSQKGHREAQLNPKYNNVCVRHGNNMYVVIFGE